MKFNNYAKFLLVFIAVTFFSTYTEALKCFRNFNTTTVDEMDCDLKLNQTHCVSASITSKQTFVFEKETFLILF